jgi:superfamily II DNA/RNA helicase
MSISPCSSGLSSTEQAQRAIVGHGEGPLLVIAEPGSGKTFSLVLRTMNLLRLARLQRARSCYARLPTKPPLSSVTVSPQRFVKSATQAIYLS